MDGSICPQCGATIHPVTIGPLRDKFMRCDHCEYQVDVPDTSSVDEAEESGPYVTEDGTVVRRGYRRVVTRSDSPVDLREFLAQRGADGSDIDAISELDSAEAVVDKVRAVLGDAVAEEIAQIMNEHPMDSVAVSRVMWESRESPAVVKIGGGRARHVPAGRRSEVFPVWAVGADVGPRLWLRWVLANTVGWVVGVGGAMATGLAVTDTLPPGEYAGLLGVVAAFLVSMPMTAAAVGVAQWLALRRHLRRAGWWILVSAVGMAVGLGIAVSVGRPPLGDAVLGAIVGAAQWPILQRHVRGAGWWILANAAGMAIGRAMASDLRMGDVDLFVGMFVGPAAIGAMITGVALVWLLRQPTAPQPGGGPIGVAPSANVEQEAALGANWLIRALHELTPLELIIVGVLLAIAAALCLLAVANPIFRAIF